MVSGVLIITLLIHSSLGYIEDNYQIPSDLLDNPYVYPEDIANTDTENEYEMHRRNNNNFLRFGRSGKMYDSDYEEYSKNFARPTRAETEKSDNFIRFGRSQQDFLRFGRDPHRVIRGKNTNHLRFGRSVSDEKIRNKRETEFKRGGGSNFMRFGRNSNFLRFGRDNLPTDMTLINNQLSQDLDKMKYQMSPLMQLLYEILENTKKENSKCSNSV